MKTHLPVVDDAGHNFQEISLRAISQFDHDRLQYVSIWSCCIAVLDEHLPLRETRGPIYEWSPMRGFLRDLRVFGRVDYVTQQPVVRASLLNIVSTWTSGCGEVLPQVEESCRGYKCSAKIPAPARHTVLVAES